MSRLGIGGHKMPFVTVSGFPDGYPKDRLRILRRNLVAIVADEMNVPKKWVRVFLHPDLLEEPEQSTLGEDGTNTIFVLLTTGLFYKRSADDDEPRRVTDAIAHFIWEEFGGLREVECMVSSCNSAWTSLKKVV